MNFWLSRGKAEGERERVSYAECLTHDDLAIVYLVYTTHGSATGLTNGETDMSHLIHNL